MYKVIDNCFSEEVSNLIENLIVKENIIQFEELPINVYERENIDENLFCKSKSYTKMLVIKNNIVYDSASNFINFFIGHLANVLNQRYVISSMRLNYVNKKCNAPTLKYDIPHVDIKNIEKNMYTLIYYINSSHGDTIIFNEKCKGTNYIDEIPKKLTCIDKIVPKKNRLLIFESDTIHSAPSYCSEDRYLINLNITTEFPIF